MADRIQGAITVGDKTFDYASGGAGRGNIPAGSWELMPFLDVGQRGSFPLPSFQISKENAFEDPRYPGAPREGMLIHPGNRNDVNLIYTLGCLGIPPSQWPDFKQAVIAAQAKYGSVVLSVDARGNAAVHPANAVPSNVSVAPNTGAFISNLSALGSEGLNSTLATLGISPEQFTTSKDLGPTAGMFGLGLPPETAASFATGAMPFNGSLAMMSPEDITNAIAIQTAAKEAAPTPTTMAYAGPDIGKEASKAGQAITDFFSRPAIDAAITKGVYQAYADDPYAASRMAAARSATEKGEARVNSLGSVGNALGSVAGLGKDAVVNAFNVGRDVLGGIAAPAMETGRGLGGMFGGIAGSLGEMFSGPAPATNASSNYSFPSIGPLAPYETALPGPFGAPASSEPNFGWAGPASGGDINNWDELAYAGSQASPTSTSIRDDNLDYWDYASKVESPSAAYADAFGDRYDPGANVAARGEAAPTTAPTAGYSMPGIDPAGLNAFGGTLSSIGSGIGNLLSGWTGPAPANPFQIASSGAAFPTPSNFTAPAASTRATSAAPAATKNATAAPARTAMVSPFVAPAISAAASGAPANAFAAAAGTPDWVQPGWAYTAPVDLNPSSPTYDPSGGSDYGYAISPDGMVDYQNNAGNVISYDSTVPGGVSYSDWASSSDSGGGGDSETVLCGYYMRKGWLRPRLWMADVKFSCKLPREIQRGYLAWARPLVDMMEAGDLRGRIVERIMWPIVSAWANFAAYREGVITRRPIFGTALHYLGTPVCWLIGRRHYRRALARSC